MDRSPTDFKSVVYAIPPLAQNGVSRPTTKTEEMLAELRLRTTLQDATGDAAAINFSPSAEETTIPEAA